MMNNLLIQQELKWEENSRIYGKMLLNINDERFRKEVEEKGYGYLDFSYDVAGNSFNLESTNAPETVKRYGSEIVAELLGKVRMVKSYWDSEEYRRYKNVKSFMEHREAAQ
jgi:hypothetical protein